jgi:hypothetical protein
MLAAPSVRAADAIAEWDHQGAALSAQSTLTRSDMIKF